MKTTYHHVSTKHQITCRIILNTMICLIIAFLLYDHFYYRQVFKYSIGLIIELQKLKIYGLAYFISHILFYIIFLYTPLAFVIRNTTPRLLLNLIQFFFNIYLYTVFKMIIRGSRPSFESVDLQAAHGYCENDYGNPSGHAMVSINVLLLMANDLSRNFKRIPKICIYLACLCVSLAICLSRLYFGVHSLDQTILGLSLGFCTFLFFEVYEGPLTELLIIPILYKEGGKAKETRNLLLVLLLVFNLIIYLLWGICYYAENTRTNYFDFVQNCHMVFHRHPNFSSKLLGDGLLINSPLGILLGLLDSTHNVRLATNFFYDRNVFKCILRIIIAVCVYLSVFTSYYPRYPNVLISLARATLMVFFTGYMMGRYLFNLFDFLQISYKKHADKTAEHYCS